MGELLFMNLSQKERFTPAWLSCEMVDSFALLRGGICLSTIQESRSPAPQLPLFVPKRHHGGARDDSFSAGAFRFVFQCSSFCESPASSSISKTLRTTRSQRTPMKENVVGAFEPTRA